jgi:polyribonucleotide nucleotidyltransferase
MEQNIKKYQIDWANKKLTIEIGKYAKQADTSVTVQYGDTVILATVVCGKHIRDNIAFLPLSVEYEERFYAAGKIKGSRFIKREGRASDEATLSARLVDRAIRPLFANKIMPDVQVVLTILSVDGENDPDIPSLIGAFVALSISDIVWGGPIGAIKVGHVDGSFVFNPTRSEREKSLLEITMAGTSSRITEIEAGAREATEELVFESIKQGKKYLDEIVTLINTIVKNVGKQKKLYAVDETVLAAQKDLDAQIRTWLTPKLQEKLFNTPKENKISRQLILTEIKNEMLQFFGAQEALKTTLAKYGSSIFETIVENEVTQSIIQHSKRLDNRKLDEVRPLSMEVGVLPRTHGAATFSRGDSQILSVITLGAPHEEQILDTMEESRAKRFIHHYNFPPYSVGEIGALRGPGRREIGHGALAEKGLLAILPDQVVFPYTIRLVSEVLGSNGSSSMASVCCSSLTLMDAGVPIKKHVAGIAMGLASDKDGNYKIITDLQDLEDGPGGMDFKIAGTKDGITAIQMDTKTTGLTDEIIEKALIGGKIARMEILDAMSKTIATPRAELSEYAPRIISLNINPEKIRFLIGPGGKVINDIINKTGVKIDVDNDGVVNICSANGPMLQKALEMVTAITREAAVGEIFNGRVVKIVDFGAFIEILPNQEGLVHISEMANNRVNKVSDILNVGDTVPVKVINIDDTGRISLSIKQIAQK